MILEAWEAHVAMPARSTILPDGCQDLLFTALPGEAPRWEITSLDDTPYKIDIPAGAYFKGFRMQVGVGFLADNLLASVHGLLPNDAGVEDRLLNFSSHNSLVLDALEALARQATFGGNVAFSAADISVHQRQLQRAMALHTGRSAAAWLGLARVRKAARAIRAGGALSEVAYDTGFSDQSHMTRAFRQWLGTTPKNAPRLSSGYS